MPRGGRAPGPARRAHAPNSVTALQYWAFRNGGQGGAGRGREGLPGEPGMLPVPRGRGRLADSFPSRRALPLDSLAPGGRGARRAHVKGPAAPPPPPTTPRPRAAPRGAPAACPCLLTRRIIELAALPLASLGRFAGAGARVGRRWGPGGAQVGRRWGAGGAQVAVCLPGALGPRRWKRAPSGCMRLCVACGCGVSPERVCSL